MAAVAPIEPKNGVYIGLLSAMFQIKEISLTDE